MTIITDVESDISVKLKDLQPPAAPVLLLTASHAQSGPAIDPLKRVFLYSSGEWEGFVYEWAQRV